MCDSFMGVAIITYAEYYLSPPLIKKESHGFTQSGDPLRPLPWLEQARRAHAKKIKDSDDESLLAAIKKGNHRAYATLVQRHTNLFYSLAYKYVQRQEAAEDIVQEAFLKIWEHPHDWSPDQNTAFTTWFYRVVVNLCLDWKKRKDNTVLTGDTPVLEIPATQEADMIAGQRQAAFEYFLEKLPQRQKAALHLCFTQGLSNQQAATMMGLGLKAFQSLIMRAKETLKKKMQAYQKE